ncbi:rhodanese-like domain-containing protein [Halorarum salinum]|nr:rhodanese-like domain-containing protein [Halobaculum salinum]
MNRRVYLQSAGLISTVSLTGCLGESNGEAVNEFGYDTKENAETEVPLLPLEDAIDWHDAGDAVFVDARSRVDFAVGHIEGAVHSPAPDGKDEDDPIAELNMDTRIATYCDIPEELAVQRGSSLIKEGYRHTYALADGFDAWSDAEYPVGYECSCDQGT